MQHTYLQKYAKYIMELGENTLITGGAGVGKTSIVREYIQEAMANGKQVMVCAPTGMAALNLGGVTMHHQFGIPMNEPIVRTRNLKINYVDDTLVNTDILVLEEGSTCRVDWFDYMANQILLANSRRKATGRRAIQFIVVADFFQTPPVLRPEDKYALDKYYGFDVGLAFPFYSEFWYMFKFRVVQLLEVVRQSDKEFIANLNKLRVGDKTVLDYFYEASSSEEIEDAINLYGTNENVDSKNQLELNKIGSESKVYHAKYTGKTTVRDSLAVEHLELKVGARVMSVVNNSGLVNGLTGTVLDLYDNSVLVGFDSGVTVEVTEYTWDINRYNVSKDGDLELEQVGSITQIPLKLAYAVTIHKSQGQTYDKVNISPYTWDCGQLYVALSRCRTIEGIHLNYKIEPYYSKTSLNVIAFYNSIVSETNTDLTLDEMERAKKPIEHKKLEQDSDMKKITNMMNNLFTS